MSKYPNVKACSLPSTYSPYNKWCRTCELITKSSWNLEKNSQAHNEGVKLSF